MHSYSSDHAERRRVFLTIVALSALAAYLLHLLLSLTTSSVLWWVDVPSVLGFFGLIQTVFDKSLWRMAPVRRLLCITIPDLNGTWKGTLVSSYDNHESPTEAKLTVAQNWTSILISLETATSISHSRVAGFVQDQPTCLSLTYEYLCEPLAGAIGTMHTHRGTGELCIKAGGLLEGEYYTGRDRQTYGSLHFRRAKFSKRSTNHPVHLIG